MNNIYVYTAGEAGLFVNSYLVELDDGVVAVDATLLNSDARAFRARLDALHKPLLGVLITHPHPDHYNGLVELVGAQDVPIYALPEVERTIRETAGNKRAQWRPTYGDEWPETTLFPNTVVQDGDVVEVGGAAFRALDLGPGESASETVWVLDGSRQMAFVGDLVFNGVHAYNADGRSGAWIDSLARGAAALSPAALLYPGHGAPGGIELLDDQRRYLLMFREAVRTQAGGRDTLTPEDKNQLEARMSAFLPGPLAWLAGLSADAVAAELARESDHRAEETAEVLRAPVR